ncbi:predicted protein [Naegleria gruberi]|uniref:Predicted protein n=1 Tax=Naegleria gruberi TaxID=5762 RepID=D2VHD6_NAEGR|nr:uncharacterized protein NAEGRDRAFT_68179 [Naegleria gruberi]EFC43869.1 predicted protein [Naegleria gruberi]|eukprot:XP_002676613.1 predicted protein [Naegleria gruberi strain NEG-M]
MGGEIVSDDHQFPHAASLQVTIEGDSYHLCGASLIDHRWLVTASHCCFDDNGGKLDASTLSVVLGNSNLRKCSSRMNVKRNGCIRKKVNQLIPHPLYDSSEVVNDIALIELKDAVEFSTSIRPIEIPDDNPEEGTDLTLAGWGSDPNDKKSTYLLKEANFPLLNERACGNIGLSISRNRGQICAGKDGSDACSGDSGSALFQNKGSCEESEEFYCYSIAGLVSYGEFFYIELVLIFMYNS